MVAERDYVLAHIVAQLSHAVLADGGRLTFKGGTALRFVHVSYVGPLGAERSRQIKLDITADELVDSVETLEAQRS